MGSSRSSAGIGVPSGFISEEKIAIFFSEMNGNFHPEPGREKSS